MKMIRIKKRRLEPKAAEDCRTPRRFATQLSARSSEGFGVRQSSAAFTSDAARHFESEELTAHCFLEFRGAGHFLRETITSPIE